MVATSPRVADTNRRAVLVLAADSSIVVFSPGTMHGDALGGGQVAVEFDQRCPVGVEREDLAIDPAAAAGRVVDLARAGLR